MVESYHIPRHWMNGGRDEIGPIVEDYIDGKRLSTHQVMLLRWYLISFMKGADLKGPIIQTLREEVCYLREHHDADAWIKSATEAGVCPL